MTGSGLASGEQVQVSSIYIYIYIVVVAPARIREKGETTVTTFRDRIAIGTVGWNERVLVRINPTLSKHCFGTPETQGGDHECWSKHRRHQEYIALRFYPPHIYMNGFPRLHKTPISDAALTAPCRLDLCLPRIIRSTKYYLLQ